MVLYPANKRRVTSKMHGRTVASSSSSRESHYLQFLEWMTLSPTDARSMRYKNPNQCRTRWDWSYLTTLIHLDTLYTIAIKYSPHYVRVKITKYRKCHEMFFSVWKNHPNGFSCHCQSVWDVLSKFLPMWPIVQCGFVCLVCGIYSADEG
jgi:hypothetical protein